MLPSAQLFGQPGIELTASKGLPSACCCPAVLLRAVITVRTTGDSNASAMRSDQGSPDLQQPLSLAAAEAANRQPGLKEQRLVTALWNLDRIDQQQLPLNSTFTYGSVTAPGTGGALEHAAASHFTHAALGQLAGCHHSCVQGVL